MKDKEQLTESIQCHLKALAAEVNLLIDIQQPGTDAKARLSLVKMSVEDVRYDWDKYIAEYQRLREERAGALMVAMGWTD